VCPRSRTGSLKRSRTLGHRTLATIRGRPVLTAVAESARIEAGQSERDGGWSRDDRLLMRGNAIGAYGASVAGNARRACATPTMPHIAFTTRNYASPGHEVTVRDLVDGWDSAHYGTYDGAWTFDLTDAKNDTEFQFMSSLISADWMNGDNIGVGAAAGALEYGVPDARARDRDTRTPRFSEARALAARRRVDGPQLDDVRAASNVEYDRHHRALVPERLGHQSGRRRQLPQCGARGRCRCSSRRPRQRGGAALHITDTTTRAIVLGVLTVLAGLGFGPASPTS
jgi:hypothetical protein